MYTYLSLPVLVSDAALSSRDLGRERVWIARGGCVCSTALTVSANKYQGLRLPAFFWSLHRCSLDASLHPGG